MLGEVVLPAGTIKRIHVNQHLLRRWKATGEVVPIYTVKHKGTTHVGHRVTWDGRSWLAPPGNPLPCGAHVWIETKGRVIIEKGPAVEAADPG